MCQHRKRWNILEKQYKTKQCNLRKLAEAFLQISPLLVFPTFCGSLQPIPPLSPPQTLLIALPLFTNVIYCLTPREYLWWFWFDCMCCLTLDWSHPVFAPVLARRVFFVHQMSTNMICCNNRQNGYLSY